LGNVGNTPDGSTKSQKLKQVPMKQEKTGDGREKSSCKVRNKEGWEKSPPSNGLGRKEREKARTANA